MDFMKQRNTVILGVKKKMLDSVKEKMEEYYDYITDTNNTIESGIHTLKNIFGDIVERYRK